MHQDFGKLVIKLSGVLEYEDLFGKAFSSPEINVEKVSLALEAYLLTLISTDSKFDQALRGEVSLNPEEQRGLELFFMEYEPAHNKKGADCFHCHGGKFFSDFAFHNNGLIDVDDLGAAGVTELESDEGKFATPSLRNVALTAPYMHDGRFKTLEEVVTHYSSEVKRTKNLDPNLAKHPVGGIELSPEDQSAIVAFLKTLTDPKFTEEGK